MSGHPIWRMASSWIRLLLVLEIAALAFASLDDFVVKDIDGNDIALKTITSKATLVINVASE